MNLRQYLKSIAPSAAAILLAACGGSSEPESETAAKSAAEQPTGQPTAAAPGAAAAPAVTYDCPDDEPTLVDICLGMPPDQVKAVLLERDPEMPIRERRATIDYTDGAQKLRTDPYINRIRAETADDEYFEFIFSAPPGEGRLTHMQRSMGSDMNLPAIDLLIEALVDNYGEPTSRFRGQNGAELVATLRWEFPAGRVICSDSPTNEAGQTPNLTGNIGVGSNVEAMLNRLRAKGIQDPARCAGWLQIHLRTFDENEPVRAVDMVLTDFATAVAKTLESYAWLEGLEAKARADRLANAEVPDL